MKLANGFEIQVDEKALHDWAVVKTICRIDKGDSSLLPELFYALLGEEQVDALEAHLRATTGACSVEDMTAVLVEIFNALKEPEKK